ncbi:MAG TPA: sortase [Candidatus Saccharimonadales bacterium]|nr:sortase [Candidatus Saccharimonadales bacterium]
MAIVNAESAGRYAESVLASVRSNSAMFSGEPTKIVLPRQGIDLPIVDGIYDGTQKVWSVARTTANFATITAQPNNAKDKTLIYGHWTPQVFGPTSNLKAGDFAYVYTSNGHIFQYRYENQTVIKPTDTQIFNNLNGKPGLALMTCEGTWAQDRRLMFFNLESAK